MRFRTLPDTAFGASDSNCGPHQLMQPQYCGCAGVCNRNQRQLQRESKSPKTPATERCCGRNVTVLWPQLDATTETQFPHLNQPIVDPKNHSPSSLKQPQIDTPTAAITAAHPRQPLQPRWKPEPVPITTSPQSPSHSRTRMVRDDWSFSN